MSVSRSQFIGRQVYLGVSAEAAERAANHMTAGRVVPDNITDPVARTLAYAMLREARGEPAVRETPVIPIPNAPFRERPSHAQDAHAILDWAQGVSHDALPDDVFVRIVRVIAELENYDEGYTRDFPAGNYGAELLKRRTREEKK